jgi:hypothetical protein
VATKDKEILALKDEITANKSAFDKDNLCRLKLISHLNRPLSTP